MTIGDGEKAFCVSCMRERLRRLAPWRSCTRDGLNHIASDAVRQTLLDLLREYRLDAEAVFCVMRAQLLAPSSCLP